MLALNTCQPSAMRGICVRGRLSGQPQLAALQAGAAAGVRRRQAMRCLAMADKEGDSPSSSTQQQQESVPSVPDTPPAGGASQQPTAEPSMTVEEIQRAAAVMRQQKAAQASAGKDNLIEGVTEEVRLIKWPAPVTAVFNTLLVIGIVAGTAFTLLAINGLLTQLSDAIY